MRHSRILTLGALVLLLATCAQIGYKPTPVGVAPFVPFDVFLNKVRAARYKDYAGRQGMKVRDEAAFEEMRAHILRMYDGVHPVHTFVVGRQLFDCVPVDSQPSVHLLKLDRVERTPPTGTSAYSAGKAPGSSKALDSPLVLGLTDPYGNAVSCVSGTFPMARITLETVTRFTTLNEFFGKGPGIEGVPTDRQGEILPGDGKDHRYATARRNDVTSFGGNSWLNLWMPTGGFTLSQQWYAGGSGSDQQTVEGGWVVYKEKFNSDKPVLFIFFTADNYGTKKCYNTLCAGFVQTNNNWYLGGPWTNYSTTGGTQWGFEMQWKLFRGNWWLFLKGSGNYEAVGYYPTSIFGNGQMSRNATQITYGGEVVGPSPFPQMGSGESADKGWQRAAFQKLIFYIPRDEDDGVGVWTDLKVIPPDKCYSLDLVPASNGGDWGEYFFFGGPGGDC